MIVGDDSTSAGRLKMCIVNGVAATQFFTVGGVNLTVSSIDLATVIGT